MSWKQEVSRKSCLPDEENPCGGSTGQIDCPNGKEGIPQELKPAFVVTEIAKAKALAYLGAKAAI
jgi:hypothetical protein